MGRGGMSERVPVRTLSADLRGNVRAARPVADDPGTVNLSFMIDLASGAGERTARADVYPTPWGTALKLSGEPMCIVEEGTCEQDLCPHAVLVDELEAAYPQPFNRRRAGWEIGSRPSAHALRLQTSGVWRDIVSLGDAVYAVRAPRASLTQFLRGVEPRALCITEAVRCRAHAGSAGPDCFEGLLTRSPDVQALTPLFADGRALTRALYPSGSVRLLPESESAPALDVVFRPSDSESGAYLALAIVDDDFPYLLAARDRCGLCADPQPCRHANLRGLYDDLLLLRG